MDGNEPLKAVVAVVRFLRRAAMPVAVLWTVAAAGPAEAEAAGSWSGFGVCGEARYVLGLWLRDDGRATFRVRRAGEQATRGYPGTWSLDVGKHIMMVTANTARIRFVGRMAADGKSMGGRLAHPADGCNELPVRFRKAD